MKGDEWWPGRNETPLGALDRTGCAAAVAGRRRAPSPALQTHTQPLRRPTHPSWRGLGRPRRSRQANRVSGPLQAASAFAAGMSAGRCAASSPWVASARPGQALHCLKPAPPFTAPRLHGKALMQRATLWPGGDRGRLTRCAKKACSAPRRVRSTKGLPQAIGCDTCQGWAGSWIAQPGLEHGPQRRRWPSDERGARRGGSRFASVRCPDRLWHDLSARSPASAAVRQTCGALSDGPSGRCLADAPGRPVTVTGRESPPQGLRRGRSTASAGLSST